MIIPKTRGGTTAIVGHNYTKRARKLSDLSLADAKSGAHCRAIGLGRLRGMKAGFRDKLQQIFDLINNEAVSETISRLDRMLTSFDMEDRREIARAMEYLDAGQTYEAKGAISKVIRRLGQE
jgi:hypothetical protein